MAKVDLNKIGEIIEILVKQYTNNSVRRDDIRQNAWLGALVAINRLNEIQPHNPIGYIISTARYYIYKVFPSFKQTELCSDLPDRVSNIDNIVLNDMIDVICKTPQERLILEARLRGHTWAQIAEALNTNAINVRRKMNPIIRRLYEVLGKDDAPKLQS